MYTTLPNPMHLMQLYARLDVYGPIFCMKYGKDEVFGHEMKIEMVADWAINPIIFYQSCWEGPAKHAKAKSTICDIGSKSLTKIVSVAVATAHSWATGTRRPACVRSPHLILMYGCLSETGRSQQKVLQMSRKYQSETFRKPMALHEKSVASLLVTRG